MSISSAAWSAIATGFAAVASVSMWITQRRALRESVRPHLVLVGWSRKQDGSDDNPQDVISIAQIKNVGTGVALHVTINAGHSDEDGLPEHVMGTERVPLISSGEAVNVECPIRVYWKNIPFDAQGAKGAAIKIKVKHWDTLDNCYQTEYVLMAITEDSPVAMVYEILPDVMLVMRHVRLQTNLMRQIKKGARRIPFVRNYVKFL